MGMYTSTVIVTGADRGVRRALTAEPPSRGVREWVARPGGGTP